MFRLQLGCNPCHRIVGLLGRKTCGCGESKDPAKMAYYSSTQEWHLSDAAQAPSQPPQIHMQGRASCSSASETRAAHSSRACEPASGRLLGTQIKPPDWPSEAPYGALEGQSGGWLASLFIELHWLTTIARRSAATPAGCHCHLLTGTKPSGCWVDGGGSCMVDGDPCHGDEEAVPGGEASEHAARGGAAVERLRRRWPHSEPLRQRRRRPRDPW